MLDSKIKLLRYRDHIDGILAGKLLPPIMADVDLVSGACNIDCEWCAQRTSRELQTHAFMPLETIERMGEFCRGWGIRSWRIAGDGEPTLHPNLSALLSSGHDAGIAMGLKTNGILLDRIRNLDYLSWLGISLDACTPETWARLKNAPEDLFYRIIGDVEQIHHDLPELDITLNFVVWCSDTDLSREDFDLDASPTKGISNYGDVALLPKLAGDLGVNFALHNALPKRPVYRFNRCRATPLYGTFGANHRFYLCCDVRSRYVLTDDYTRDNWGELPRMWGSQEHLEKIGTVMPESCKFCSKEWLNTILESVVLDGKQTPEYQIEFI